MTPCEYVRPHHLIHELGVHLYLQPRVTVIVIWLLREAVAIAFYCRHVAGVLPTQHLCHWYVRLGLCGATDEGSSGASGAADGTGDLRPGTSSPLSIGDILERCRGPGTGRATCPH